MTSIVSAPLPGTFPGPRQTPDPSGSLFQHKTRLCAKAPSRGLYPTCPWPCLGAALPVSILAGRTRCSPAYRPSLMPTASKQNPAQPLLTSLAPPSCCLPEFAPCSHHTKLLRFPRQTLLLPFCVLFQALPLPTGLGETQMSPPWGPFAGPAVAGSLTHAPSAPPPCALTACSELSTLDHDEHLVGQDVP